MAEDVHHNTCSTNLSLSINSTALICDPWYFYGRAAARYLTAPILIIGLLGNILSFLVATRQHNRQRPYSICIAMLAVADTAAILIGQLQGWLLHHFYQSQMTVLLCSELYFSHVSMGNWSAWIVVIITYERFMHVCKPSLSGQWCTVRATYITLAVTLLVCLLKNSHYFKVMQCYSSLDNEIAICLMNISNMTSEIVLNVFELLFNSVLPFGCVIGFNVRTIIVLCRHERSLSKSQTSIDESSTARKNSTASTAANVIRKISRTISHSEINTNKCPATERDNINLTVMLLSVSFAFVILTSPLYIFRCVFVIIDPFQDTETLGKYFCMDCIFGLFFISNSCINFYLYCLTGTAFRKDVYDVFLGVILCKTRFLAKYETLCFDKRRQTSCGQSTDHLPVENYDEDCI